LPNHHCVGGVYGTTAGGAAPYVTGAVAQGSQAGAGGQGGGHGAGLGRHQLQQPQPAQLTATNSMAERSDILFIMCLLTGNFRCLYYGREMRRFAAAIARAGTKFGHSTIPGEK
jgi:hypothetical protein